MPIQISPFVCNMIEENTYLLSTSEGKAAIIDCGCASPEEQQRLDRRVREWGLEVEYLLFTHLHFDHVWGLPWAANTFPHAKIYAHAREISEAASPSEQMQAWGFGEWAYDMVSLDIRPLPQNAPLYLGDTSIYDLFVPGHTIGHVAYYLPAERVLFSGDVLFYHNIGRSDLPGGNYDTLMHSIKSELLTLPDDTRVYPGHGPMTTIYEERNNNPYIN